MQLSFASDGTKCRILNFSCLSVPKSLFKSVHRINCWYKGKESLRSCSHVNILIAS